MGQVTVVTSGKGGAGKSTVTAGLGCALARLGRKVLLVDADAGLRSLDLLLGIGGAAVYDIADVFAGNCEPIRAIYPSPICSGVFVAPAPVSLEQLCAPEDMRLLCRGFSRYYDDVIIDCPAGVGQGFRTAVAGAEAALVVTTPDMVCARDAQVVGHLLFARDLPARLIINRLRPEMIARGDMMSVEDVTEILAIDLLGVIPDDESVVVATNQGEPVVGEDSLAGKCYQNICRRLLGEEVPISDFNHKPGLRSKLSSLFHKN